MYLTHNIGSASALPIIMQTSAFAHYTKYCSSFRNSPVDHLPIFLVKALQRYPASHRQFRGQSGREQPHRSTLFRKIHPCIPIGEYPLQKLSSQAVAKSLQVQGINSNRWQVDNSGKVAVVGDKAESIQEVQELVFCRAGCFMHCCKCFHVEKLSTHSCCSCKDSSNSEAKGQPSFKRLVVTVDIINEQDEDEQEGLQQ